MAEEERRPLNAGGGHKQSAPAQATEIANVQNPHGKPCGRFKDEAGTLRYAAVRELQEPYEEGSTTSRPFVRAAVDLVSGGVAATLDENEAPCGSLKQNVDDLEAACPTDDLEIHFDERGHDGTATYRSPRKCYMKQQYLRQSASSRKQVKSPAT